MKKLVASIIAVSMVVSMAGCAGSADTEKDPVISAPETAPAVENDMSMGSVNYDFEEWVGNINTDYNFSASELLQESQQVDEAADDDEAEDISDAAQEYSELDTDDRSLLTKLMDEFGIGVSEDIEGLKQQAVELIKDCGVAVAYQTIQEEITIFSSEIDRKGADTFAPFKENHPFIYKLGAFACRKIKDHEINKLRDWIDELFAENGYQFN